MPLEQRRQRRELHRRGHGETAVEREGGVAALESGGGDRGGRRLAAVDHLLVGGRSDEFFAEPPLFFFRRPLPLRHIMIVPPPIPEAIGL